VDYKEIGRIFYRDGYRLAARYLEEDLNEENLLKAIRHLYDSMDELLDAFLQRSAAEGKPAECRKGCHWCCHQAVFATTHEILFLGMHVRKNHQAKEQESFLERAREKSLLTAGRSLEEQLKIRKACPFLYDGSCSVYPARPMACRIYLSSSEAACRREFDDPGDQRSFPELFEFPLQAGRMLNEGFVAWLKQHGKVSSELLLEQGYAAMLTHGQSFASWLA
jgi:Fe-S-cluster containining protein